MFAPVAIPPSDQIVVRPRMRQLPARERGGLGSRMRNALARKLRIRASSWGDWQHLDGDFNRPHYLALEALRVKHAPHASLLDLGCGAGLLCRGLTTHVPYIGIDLQRAAIRQATRTYQERLWTRFTCGSINDLRLIGAVRFGLIVFNEVLYYQPDVEGALQLMEAYRQHLVPGGLMLVSIFRDDDAPERMNGPMCEAVHAAYADQRIETEIVHADARRRWKISLFGSHHPSA
jgi:2-polyprenyl-3-methyl-5-hydroxy-6-metoxy-1,4-benzoquinol methylase